MLVHPRRKARRRVEVPLTSLIDMVFLLLIYFLLTTNFMVEEGINVNLPQAKAAAPQKDEVITVYVNEQGQIFLGREPVSQAALLERLRDRIGGYADKKFIVVKADRGVMLNKVVGVMDVAKAAGAERLSLATER